ncbi:MAG: pilus assembly protein PilM [Synergistaceae bacterium]|nr:pilus assembly protein PilM [Synergistaceae bacterium]
MKRYADISRELKNVMVAISFLKKQQNRAGLALHDESLMYLELSGSLPALKVVHCVAVPSGGKGVKKDSLVDAGELLNSLTALEKKIGGFRTPVALGLPGRDVLIRVLEMPELEIEDAREALRWDFEKYFPYSFADAGVDISRVENPLEGEPGSMSLLVAACRLRTMESLLRLAASSGIPLAAVEPQNVAMFRAGLGPATSFAGGYLAVFAERGTTQLVLGHRDNGILYRTSLVEIAESGEGLDFSPLVREVSNTLTFIRNQYRELEMEHVMLGGSLASDDALLSLLQETTGLNAVRTDPWEAWGLPAPAEGAAGWDAAVGLAVRNLA